MCILEEILHTSKAHWLSEDNKLLAYIQFNDTNVPLEKFPIYGDASNMYTTFMHVPYPKVSLLAADHSLAHYETSSSAM